jgi:S-formylglutathione hydrolase FrmB
VPRVVAPLSAKIEKVSTSEDDVLNNWTLKSMSVNVYPGTLTSKGKVFPVCGVNLRLAKPLPAESSADVEVKSTIGVPVCEPTFPNTVVVLVALSRKTFCSVPALHELDGSKQTVDAEAVDAEAPLANTSDSPIPVAIDVAKDAFFTENSYY